LTSSHKKPFSCSRERWSSSLLTALHRGSIFVTYLSVITYNKNAFSSLIYGSV
jgi:hypothetical protein